MSIPRRIHMLWLQGWEDAPELARICADGWTARNPAYEVVLHDAGAVRALLADFPVPVDRLPPQAAADLFRAALLLREGGVWADASLVPVAPLDDWFGRSDAYGFTAVEGWHDGRAMENWFLASAPGHPLMAQFWDAALRYWTPEPKRLADRLLTGLAPVRTPIRAHRLLRRAGLFDPPADPSDYVRPDGPRRWRHVFPYFWFQYLFGYLVASDAEFRAFWAAAPKVDPLATQWMAWHLKAAPDAPLADFLAERNRAPVQKLRFKRSLPAARMVEIAGALTA